MHQQENPLHVAIIMDGNGRWAKKRGMPRAIGHKKGVATVKRIVKHAAKSNINYLSMFAFSIENWLRPVEETSFLMGLLEEYINDERAELIEKNIVFKTSGKLDMLPSHISDMLKQLVEDTKNNSGMVLNLLISYGSKDEIVEACKQIATEIKNNVTDIDKISIDLISSKLYNPEIPDIDLLIRTSGEQRISNFMLWQSAYAELYFTNKLWPDFTEKEFDKAIVEFNKRVRRFGKTDEQLNNN